MMMMMMMRTLMLEETMGSPAKVPFHAFMYPDFLSHIPLSGNSFVSLSHKHFALSICRVTQAVKHKVPTANTCMCRHTHTHTHTHGVASQACFVVLSADPVSHGMGMCDSWR